MPDYKEAVVQKAPKKAKKKGKARHVIIDEDELDGRGVFYFELPYCLKYANIGTITIDNKDEYCFKYSVCCSLHYNDCHREHPRRHAQYEQ